MSPRIWVLPLEGDRKPIPFLRTEFNEDQGQFSPDARWVAYRSDESGRNEVYVRAFSPKSSGGKMLVSKGGGSEPRWRKDGRELVYRAPDGTLVSVTVTPGSEFQVGTAKPLFKISVPDAFLGWDVAADGTRFLVMVPDRKSTRLNSSHIQKSRMPSSA